MSIETWETTHNKAVKKAEEGVARPKLSDEDAALESWDNLADLILPDKNKAPHQRKDLEPEPNKIKNYLGIESRRSEQIEGHEHLIFFSEDGQSVVKIDKIRSHEYRTKERILVHETVRGLFPEYFPEMKKSFSTENGSGIVVERIFPDDKDIEENKTFSSFEKEFKKATGITFIGDDTESQNYLPRKGAEMLVDDIWLEAEDLTTPDVKTNIREYMEKKNFAPDRKERIRRGIRALDALKKQKPSSPLL